MTTVTIRLSQEARSELLKLAVRERRRPAAQASVLLERSLLRRRTTRTKGVGTT
jgi:predicted transcriptional regulator